MNLTKELEKFNYKKIENVDLNMNALNDIVGMMQGQNAKLDKSVKMGALNIASLKEDLEEKNKEIFKLKKEIELCEENDKKVMKKIISIVDEIVYVERFVMESNNSKLIMNIESIQKRIKKELREIGIEEIPTVGEIFNNRLHECVDVVNMEKKEKYEIIDVVKKGYTYKGSILRVASVIANN